MLVNNDAVTPCATEREEGVLDDTLVLSSPNMEGTNNSSRNTTDMPTVIEKEKETFNNAWGLLKEVVRMLHVSLITVCGFIYGPVIWTKTAT